jgi:hypothetical protein
MSFLLACIVVPIAGASAIPKQSAVHFDHLYVVLDSPTVAAAAASVFIRDTLGAFANRTTTSGDRTWSGGVLSGERTYVELFSPDAGFGPSGSSGLALSVEDFGALDDLSHAVARISGVVPRVVERTGTMAGKELRWFRALHADYPARGNTGNITRWVMEYEADFIAELLGSGATVDRADLRRRLRSRRYDPGKQLVDVVAVELASDAAELALLREELQQYGWSVTRQARGMFVAHGGGISITGVEREFVGITAVVLRLRGVLPIRGTRVIGSTEIQILSDTMARWIIRQ